MTSKFFVDIALGLPALGSFQYSVPENLIEKIAIGKRVWVSVRSRRMVGYIVGTSDKALFDEIRDIESVIDQAPIIDESLLKLTQWMSEHYFCSWGQCIEAALPAPFKKGKLHLKTRDKKNFKPKAPETSFDFKLTPHQEAAYQKILAKITSHAPAQILLYGVTGSGKTEVYMHLIREVLAQGRGAIVLVPEISLTPQAVERFRARFGDSLAIIHSRLSQGKKVEEWHRIRKSEARVVVGARSAIFSPVQNLGLIVIDEEHEASYKQEETPRYHASTLAWKRSVLENAVVVLGSATPSLESYYSSTVSKIDRVDLPERVESRPLPEVNIVDMRRQESGKSLRIFSKPLEEDIRAVLSKGEQVMLLLNRRGFSTYLHCSSCGYVMTCPNCRVTLAYHLDKASLFCHSCHYRATPIKLCPACQKNYLHYFGLGTQKVEMEAKRLFPEAKIGRMDRDSTSRKDAHEMILSAFKDREIQILIGTQMIAKGHDFPNVSLIGVVSADTALHVPDFRAAERTFSLLTQVAGRAGRGDILGKVQIQTLVPHHYSIQSAKDHDYLEFYAKEIQFRRELYLPPYSHLIQITASGPDEKEVMRQIVGLARAFEKKLTGQKWFKVMGPAPSPSSKEKNEFFWSLYFKGPNISTMNPILKEVLGEFKKSKIKLLVDVDPQ